MLRNIQVQREEKQKTTSKRSSKANKLNIYIEDIYCLMTMLMMKCNEKRNDQIVIRAMSMNLI